jgi:hypothetical protein
MHYIFVIFLLPLSVYSADMDKCNHEKDLIVKNTCLAIATGSITYCEKINKTDDKTSCMLKVRDLQRQIVNGYHPMNDANTHTR